MSGPDMSAFWMSNAAAAKPPNPPPTICAFICPLPGSPGWELLPTRARSSNTTAAPRPVSRIRTATCRGNRQRRIACLRALVRDYAHPRSIAALEIVKRRHVIEHALRIPLRCCFKRLVRILIIGGNRVEASGHRRKHPSEAAIIVAEPGDDI